MAAAAASPFDATFERLIQTQESRGDLAGEIARLPIDVIIGVRARIAQCMPVRAPGAEVLDHQLGYMAMVLIGLDHALRLEEERRKRDQGRDRDAFHAGKLPNYLQQYRGIDGRGDITSKIGSMLYDMSLLPAAPLTMSKPLSREMVLDRLRAAINEANRIPLVTNDVNALKNQLATIVARVRKITEDMEEQQPSDQKKRREK